MSPISQRLSPVKAGKGSASDEVPGFAAAAATPEPFLAAARPPDAAPEETHGEENGVSQEAAAEDGPRRIRLNRNRREDPSLLPPAAKKMKIETKERKEKKHTVDEDEIQKMQILVSSFSEEQLTHYEMYC